MTSVFQGLSNSCSEGRVGENPGNEVGRTLGMRLVWSLADVPTCVMSPSGNEVAMSDERGLFSQAG